MDPANPLIQLVARAHRERKLADHQARRHKRCHDQARQAAKVRGAELREAVRQASRKGISDDDLARICEVKPATIRKWIINKHPNDEHILRRDIRVLEAP